MSFGWMWCAQCNKRKSTIWEHIRKKRRFTWTHVIWIFVGWLCGDICNSFCVFFSSKNVKLKSILRTQIQSLIHKQTCTLQWSMTNIFLNNIKFWHKNLLEISSNFCAFYGLFTLIKSQNFGCQRSTQTRTYITSHEPNRSELIFW